MFKNITFTTLLLLVSILVQGQTEWQDMPLTDGTFSDAGAEFKQGDYEIMVRSGSALEFKVGMQAQDYIVYTWSAAMSDPAMMDVEFHGHTEPVDGKGNLMFYKIHNEGRGSGTLKAPFTGIHGWYLNNRSEEDILVKMTISGFYEDIE